jgi:DNA-binding beta-propeller fold protein YncE
MAAKQIYPLVKSKDNISKLPLLSKCQLALIILIISVLQPGLFSPAAMAEPDATFLYSLSDFNGPIPFNWANISADQARNEIYVVDTRDSNITVFNSQGMEVYRFADDRSLGPVIDVAVKEDGNILVLSKEGRTSSITLCNYRGQPIGEVELKNLPADFSNFSPDRIVIQRGLIHLLDSQSMKIAVTDLNGLFQKGYNLLSILHITNEDTDRTTEIAGFSVDRQGNVLFTVPVLFRAYQLSPEGELTSFGVKGSAPGRFNQVGGIVADDSYYYVTDKLKSAVLIFDKDRNFQSEFGYRGVRPGNLLAPTNLALDGKGKLYVSQLGKRGVSVFQISH